MGIAAKMVLAEPHQLNHLQSPGVQLILIGDHLVNQQSFADDLLDGHTGVQGGDGVLENHLDSLVDHLLILRAQLAGDEFAVEVDLASGRLVKADNGPACGGLAAAGLAHQAVGLSAGDFKTDVVHRLDHDLAPANAAFEVLL